MDHYQVLKQSTIQSVFADEYHWIKQNRWNLADNNQANMLLLLDADQMSMLHLNQVRGWMQAEVAAKIKQEEDAKRKARDPSHLSGGYVRQ